MKQNNIQIPEGYINSSLGIIPNDWEVKRLGAICEIKGGYAFDSKSFLSEGQYQIIKMSNLYEGKLDLKRSQSFLNAITNQERDYLLQEGNIIITLTGTVGKRDYGYTYQITNEKNLLLNQRVARIIPKNAETHYLFYLLNTSKFLNQFFFSSRGGTGNQANVSTLDVTNIKVTLPPLPQQQKIAEILGTWDEAIEKQSQLIDKLTERKRGLMQQLLTGKKRLAGFSEEWKEVRLGEIGETYTGLTGKTKENFGTGNPFITYMNVYNSFQINTTQMDYVYLEKDENQNIIKYGDVFFTISSETPHEVGMSSVLLDKIENTYLNSFCFGYRLYSFKTLTPEFAKYYLRSKSIRLEMYKLAQGSTRFNLSKSEVLKIKVILPNITEQTAIANILTAADKEIELAKSQLELLRSQKSGLMQQLLTGKTRVKID